MRVRITALLLCLVLSPAGLVVAQDTEVRTLRGSVSDATSGESLPGASIQVEGTYSGTITNADGAFELAVPTGGHVLIVRFIGYATESVQIDQGSNGLDIQLQRSTVMLPEITITGEDPAIRIMRRVIEEKQKWRQNLRTYTVNAYNRFRMENDTGIVSIWESGTRAYWDRERGMREVSLWQEQTDNVDIDEFLPAALFVANLYDDDLDIAGHNLMGVTHPNALSKYRFRLQSIETTPERPDVFVIDVEPRQDTFSGFHGSLRVQDESFAMVSADLEPGDGFVFPPPIQYLNAAYRQQFALFGEGVWLPIDLQTRMEIKVGIDRILSFPEFRIRQMSRLSDFEVNVVLPDSLYESDDIVTVDSSVVRPAVRPLDVVAVPLTEDEVAAYASIDSTMTIEKAYEPSGVLARMARAEARVSSDTSSTVGRVFNSGGKIDLRMRPDLWYNRVEGFRLGLRGVLGLVGPVSLTGMIGWESARKAVDSGYGLQVGTANKLVVGYRDETTTTFSSVVRGRFFNSADVTLGLEDYFDYHRVSGVQAGFRSEGFTAADLEIAVSWSREDYSSLNQELETSWLGFDMADAFNPAIDEGTLERIEASVTKAWDFLRFPIGPQQRATIHLEKGLGGDIAAGTDYLRLEFDAFARLPTFFKRRLIPNALDIRMVAGKVWGNSPVQRLGTVDGSSTLTTFGAIKTIDQPPYVGDRWALFAWEHTFRTVPFEWVDWRWAVERHWNVIVHGAHGYADREKPVAVGYAGLAGQWHHEAGLSLSGLFTMFRVDTAWRLDQPGFRFGLSAARIF